MPAVVDSSPLPSSQSSSSSPPSDDSDSRQSWIPSHTLSIEMTTPLRQVKFPVVVDDWVELVVALEELIGVEFEVFADRGMETDTFDAPLLVGNIVVVFGDNGMETVTFVVVVPLIAVAAVVELVVDGFVELCVVLTPVGGFVKFCVVLTPVGGFVKLFVVLTPDGTFVKFCVALTPAGRYVVVGGFVELCVVLTPVGGFVKFCVALTPVGRFVVVGGFVKLTVVLVPSPGQPSSSSPPGQSLTSSQSPGQSTIPLHTLFIEMTSPLLQVNVAVVVNGWVELVVTLEKAIGVEFVAFADTGMETDTFDVIVPLLVGGMAAVVEFLVGGLVKLAVVLRIVGKYVVGRFVKLEVMLNPVDG